MIDNRCFITNTKIEEVKKEHDIKQLITTKNQLLNSENKINNELYYIKENYNTVLFEKLSSQNTDKSIIKDNLTTQNVKEKYETFKKELEEINRQKIDLENIFKESNFVKDLLSYLDTNKETILEDIKKSEKFYSLIICGILLYNLTRIICRTIISNQQFPVCIELTHNRINCFRYVLRRIVRWHYY